MKPQEQIDWVKKYSDYRDQYNMTDSINFLVKKVQSHQQEEIEALRKEVRAMKVQISAYKTLTETGDKIRSHQDKLLSESKTVESEREANSILTQEVESLTTQLSNEKQKAMGLVSALEFIRDGYDCDSDAHKYNTACRKCDAQTALTNYNKQD